MKKHLNYFGIAFDTLGSGYNKKFLKTKEGKKDLKKEKKLKAKLQKQLKSEGFDDSEIWNLDITVSKFLLPRLKKFKKTTISYPSKLNSIEEWRGILDKIIFSLESNITESYVENGSYKEVQEGFNLLGKYFMNLWD